MFPPDVRQGVDVHNVDGYQTSTAFCRKCGRRYKQNCRRFKISKYQNADGPECRSLKRPMLKKSTVQYAESSKRRY